MKIIWNQVTKLSQVVAILLSVGIFFAGFYIGMLYSQAEGKGAEAVNKKFMEAMHPTSATH